MVLGLRHHTHRTADSQPAIGGHDGEEVMHVQEGVAIALGSSHPPESPGTLFITSRQVVWLSDVDASKGYAVDFLSTPFLGTPKPILLPVSTPRSVHFGV